MFVDTISGALEHWPELDKLLDQLRPGSTLVVWRLDGLGRSIRHLIDQLQVLAGRGVGFRSLQWAIDTTSPGGRLVFHVFAALVEFERDLIHERRPGPRPCEPFDERDSLGRSAVRIGVRPRM